MGLLINLNFIDTRRRIHAHNHLLKAGDTFAACCCWGCKSATKFSDPDPGHTQEIFTGPLVGGPGMAWNTSNHLLTRNGSDIIEYSLVQNGVKQGTTIQTAVLTHSITGLNNSGIGITSKKDGDIYATTGVELQRFVPNNWVAPAQTLSGIVAGQGYGITPRPKGKIAYVAGPGTDEVYVYNPLSTVNTLKFTACGLIDDFAADMTSLIAPRRQHDSRVGARPIPPSRLALVTVRNEASA